MLEIVRSCGDDLERAVAQLVDQANRNGGVDNLTVILLACQRSSS
jgi:serine/threonine protein phosphatase PrpC